MDLVGNACLERNRNRTPAVPYGIGFFFLAKSTDHGLDEGVCFSPPPAANVEDEGIEPTAWVSQLFTALTPF